MLSDVLGEGGFGLVYKAAACPKGQEDIPVQDEYVDTPVELAIKEEQRGGSK
jgi:hypothetical protein